MYLTHYLLVTRIFLGSFTCSLTNEAQDILIVPKISVSINTISRENMFEICTQCHAAPGIL